MEKHSNSGGGGNGTSDSKKKKEQRKAKKAKALAKMIAESNCFICGQKGHWAGECPNAGDDSG